MENFALWHQRLNELQYLKLSLRASWGMGNIKPLICSSYVDMSHRCLPVVFIGLVPRTYAMALKLVSPALADVLTGYAGLDFTACRHTDLPTLTSVLFRHTHCALPVIPTKTHLCIIWTKKHVSVFHKRFY